MTRPVLAERRVLLAGGEIFALRLEQARGGALVVAAALQIPRGEGIAETASLTLPLQQLREIAGAFTSLADEIDGAEAGARGDDAP